VTLISTIRSILLSLRESRYIQWLGRIVLRRSPKDWEKGRTERRKRRGRERTKGVFSLKKGKQQIEKKKGEGRKRGDEGEQRNQCHIR